MKRGVLILALLLSGCLFSSSEPGGSKDSDMGSDLAGDLDNADVTNRTDAVSDTCGDGALQADEACDPGLPAESPGACPTECDDGLACTEDFLVGAPETCDAACSSRPIEVCQNNDGCCPSNCNLNNDSDCDDSAVCGDGLLAPAETCDPGITSGPGSCPIIDNCMPTACEVPRVIGSRTNCDAECSGVPIALCIDGDGCCAPGCDSTNDDDCMAGCGNGVIDSGERCDGNCPTAAMCDDGNPCTVDSLVGSDSTCDAECVHTPLDVCVDGDMCCPSNCNDNTDADCSTTCNDGTVDPPLETCEPNSATPCPDSCDDGDACTQDSSTGSPANCNVVCGNEPVSACVDGDGCCPAACNANNDNDCTPTCGNNATEDGETCDGNCPTECDDGTTCTVDSLVGDPNNCTARCDYTGITSCIDGDTCCPQACNANNDDECGSICGNNVQEPGETCDGDCPTSCNDNNACTTDSPVGSAANCTASCTHTNIAACVDGDGCCPASCNSLNDDDCSGSCGNMVREDGETCDGDCPTQSSCQAQYGACAQLTGSTGSCNVLCSQRPGCTPCDLSDPNDCPCAAGKICSGGECLTSQGDDCDAACDGDAYCGVHGPGSMCSQFSTCVDCTMNAQCAFDETCESALCVPASSCDEAGDPDQYCMALGYGACNMQQGTCMNTCQQNSQCAPTQTCSAGWCVAAMHCGEAAQPDAFCPLNFVCIGTQCRRQCNPSNFNCSCTNKSTQSCLAVQPPHCVDTVPTNCNNVCPGFRDQYCAAKNGPGSICNPITGAGPDGCGIGVGGFDMGGDMGGPPDMGPPDMNLPDMPKGDLPTLDL